jgi:hypothetical protein
LVNSLSLNKSALITGQEPFIIAKFGTPTKAPLEEAKHKNVLGQLPN